MSGVATAVVGGAYLSSTISSNATRSASRDQTRASEAATAETGREFDVAQENLAPYRDIGTEFMPQLREFMRGNYDSFLNSPDYKFTLQEGEKALGRAQSASGSRYGGRAIKEALKYNQGLSSQHINDYFNKLFNVVGIGSNAAAGTAQAALQTGQTNASILNNAGTNRANLTMANASNQAGIFNSTMGNLTTLAAYNSMQPTTWSTNYNIPMQAYSPPPGAAPLG